VSVVRFASLLSSTDCSWEKFLVKTETVRAVAQTRNKTKGGALPALDVQAAPVSVGGTSAAYARRLRVSRALAGSRILASACRGTASGTVNRKSYTATTLSISASVWVCRLSGLS